MTTVPADAKLRGVKLSERVKLVAQRSGMSLRALSASIGKSEEYLQKIIERDAKRPDAQALAALAAKVGVSEGWLIHGRGSPDDRDDHVQAPAPEDVDVAGQRSVVADAERTARPLLENLPEWPELLAGARQIAADRGRDVPDWAWTALARSGGLVTGSLSAAAVFDLAKTYADHGLGKPRPMPERQVTGVARKAKEE